MEETSEDRNISVSSELYNPPVEDDNDETHEMFNLSADEEAADEMESFLAQLEKDDISDVIRKGLKRKLEVATTKLADLFKRQQELNAEEEEQVRAELEKELHALSQQHAASAPENDRQARKQDQMKQIMLQKKVTVLTNQVELSEQKSRSVTLQW
jgi:hypothetical protein